MGWKIKNENWHVDKNGVGFTLTENVKSPKARIIFFSVFMFIGVVILLGQLLSWVFEKTSEDLGHVPGIVVSCEEMPPIQGNTNTNYKYKIEYTALNKDYTLETISSEKYEIGDEVVLEVDFDDNSKAKIRPPEEGNKYLVWVFIIGGSLFVAIGVAGIVVELKKLKKEKYRKEI